MTPETPTPETDTEEDKHGNGNAMHAHCHDSSHLSGDFADFARRLERERDAARAEIEAMREAIISSYNMLKYFEKFTPNLVDLTEQQWLNTQEGKNTVSALTKLQPFIKP